MLLLSAFSCSPQLEALPGAKISCGSDRRCPEGYACREAVGLCLPLSQTEDLAPPAIASVRILPEVCRKDERLTVELVATKPLFQVPRVTLEAGNLQRELEFVTQGADRLSFTLSYVARGDEPEQSVRLYADLLDDQGLPANGLLLGTASFDFTPPAAAQFVVTYAASATNPLSVVEQATTGTTLRVLVRPNEPLSGTPLLVARLGENTLSFEALSAQSGLYRFEATVPAGLASGTYAPFLEWTDLAGNSTVQADLPGDADAIYVQTSARSLLVDQQRVRYVRSPLGQAAAEPLNGGFVVPAGPYFALAPFEPLQGTDLPSETFAFEGGQPARFVQVWSAADAKTLLGSMAPTNTGAWPRLRLPEVDLETVYVTALDSAGNMSAPVKLQHAEWVATTNAPRFGLSPHPLWATAFAQQSALPGPDASKITDGGIESADGTGPVLRGQLAWQLAEDPSAPAPSERTGAALAYDSARGRVVLFGGSGETGALQDTWEWDGTRWEAIAVNGGPSARHGGAMVFDSARSRVLLFGGTDGVQYFADTWEWDGRAWRQQKPPGASPSGRVSHAMAYDSTRAKVVLFGGRDGATELQDTWEWDGAAWTLLGGSTGAPPGRSGHALGFELMSGRTVLFGGTAGGVPMGDTWEWNGALWTARASSGGTPGPRAQHAMAYDYSRGRLVLFGGTNGGTLLGDTWEWDGSAWSQATSSGSSPSSRGGHVMAFDLARAQVVLFGGDSGWLRAETWAWDGREWVLRRGDERLPSERVEAAMAYDSNRERVVLYGGSDWLRSQQHSDTWEWDGARWLDRSRAPGPGPRRGHAMAYDTARGRVVLFGGMVDTVLLQDTWEWDGTAWSEAPPMGAVPNTRFGHAMTYDPSRGRVLLFGGNTGSSLLQDLWEWDGASWTQIVPSGPIPPARMQHAMAYDTTRGQVLLFGGTDGGAFQDTWAWDGAAWSEKLPSGAQPLGRKGHALAFDPIRGRAILHGGLSASDAWLQDTWEWTGASWINKSALGAAMPGRAFPTMVFSPTHGGVVMPGAGRTGVMWLWKGAGWLELNEGRLGPRKRSNPALSYDRQRERVVLFGGWDGDVGYDDTWEWDGATWKLARPSGTRPQARAAHAMAFDSSHGRTVLFGGYEAPTWLMLQDTWEWDGSLWAQKATTGPRPSNRARHAMAYDAARGRVVLFGGSDGGASLQDTWEWDGISWIDVSPAAASSPSSRQAHALAYDDARGRVVLFGGLAEFSQLLNDLWEWDGQAWLERTPSSPRPPGRISPVMAYDSRRSRLIVHGGLDGVSNLGDTWEWDGTVWVELTPTGRRLPPLVSQAMAYDAAREQLLVFGGMDDNGPSTETWTLSTSPSRQPAIEFLPNGAGLESSSIESLRVRAYCSGAYAPYGAVDVGAALLGWSNGLFSTQSAQWQVLAVNAAGLSSSGTLVDWSSASPAEAQRYYLERDGSLGFQCRPVGASGTGGLEASVSLDYLEVRVRYTVF